MTRINSFQQPRRHFSHRVWRTVLRPKRFLPLALVTLLAPQLTGCKTIVAGMIPKEAKTNLSKTQYETPNYEKIRERLAKELEARPDLLE